MTEESEGHPDEYEVNSEAVRDYMQKIPHYLIRWGSVIVAFFVVSVIALAWVVKYPVQITGKMKLTSQAEPRPIVARVDGRLEKLSTRNHERVTEGQLLAFVENAADPNEVLLLDEQLQQITRISAGTLPPDTILNAPFSRLGEVQIQYMNFARELTNIRSLMREQYYFKKKQLLKDEISDLQWLQLHLAKKAELAQKDLRLSERELALNRTLFESKVIAQLDFNREESKYITKEIAFTNLKAEHQSIQAQIRAKQLQLLELEKSVVDETEKYRHSIQALQTEIAMWKKKYALISPSAGELVFAGNIQEKQNVNVGQEVFHIIESPAAYLGLISISQENAGKITMNNRVLIKFDQYPWAEYGIVEGTIAATPHVSSLSNSDLLIFVFLPQGLRTNHGKELPYRYGMTATAEIITEDLRLIERIFYSVRQVFN